MVSDLFVQDVDMAETKTRETVNMSEFMPLWALEGGYHDRIIEGAVKGYLANWAKINSSTCPNVLSLQILPKSKNWFLISYTVTSANEIHNKNICPSPPVCVRGWGDI